MFLHIGQGNLLPVKQIVMIGNLDTTQSKVTEEFLNIAKEEGFIIDYSAGKPKSFILTHETIYLSIISSKTLTKRMNNPKF